jgi:hypothetical protein
VQPANPSTDAPAQPEGTGAAPSDASIAEAPKDEAPAEMMRCPSCGHEGPESEFAMGAEPDAEAMALSSERLVRELRRRGLVVAIARAAPEQRSDAPSTSSAAPKRDRSKGDEQRASLDDEVALIRRLVNETVEEALTQKTGRLPR